MAALAGPLMLSPKHGCNVYEMVCADRNRGAAEVRDRLVKPMIVVSGHVLQMWCDSYCEESGRRCWCVVLNERLAMWKER